MNIRQAIDPDKLFLLTACMNGDVEEAKSLIEQGVDVNAKNPFTQFTAMDYASYCGEVGIVKLLIEKGVDVNAKNFSGGHTALHRASLKGHIEVIKLLIEKGADVNAKDFVGQTALHRASLNGHIEVIKLLTEKGADVNGKEDPATICEDTALSLASQNGYIEAVKLLIVKGADVNKIDTKKSKHIGDENNTKRLFKKDLTGVFNLLFQVIEILEEPTKKKIEKLYEGFYLGEMPLFIQTLDQLIQSLDKIASKYKEDDANKKEVDYKKQIIKDTRYNFKNNNYKLKKDMQKEANETIKNKPNSEEITIIENSKSKTSFSFFLSPVILSTRLKEEVKQCLFKKDN